MTFRTLLSVLEAEYQRRTGVLHDRLWCGQHGWLWDTWVREFLRTYEAPAVALVRRATP